MKKILNTELISSFAWRCLEILLNGSMIELDSPEMSCSGESLPGFVRKGFAWEEMTPRSPDSASKVSFRIFAKVGGRRFLKTSSVLSCAFVSHYFTWRELCSSKVFSPMHTLAGLRLEPDLWHCCVCTGYINPLVQRGLLEF